MVCTGSFFSQQSDIETSFINYNVEDGLPSDETYHVIQDSKGYIWIATDQGVARFDGKGFKVFSTNNGLPDDVIFQIQEDHRGRIWFSSFNCKLSYFENNKIYEFQYNDSLLNAIEGSSISVQLEIDSQDNIWIGYGNAGLFKINTNGSVEQKVNTNDSLSNGWNSRMLAYIREDVFSFGQLGNPNWSRDKNRSEIEIDHFKWRRNLEFSFEDRTVLRMAQLDNDRIAISAGENRLFVVGENSLFDTVLPSRIIDIAFIDNSLWVGTATGGVMELLVDSNQFTFGRKWLNNYSISDITKDRTDGIWITTLENGIYYCPDPSIQTLTRNASGNPLSLLDVVISDNDTSVYMVERNRNIIALNKKGKLEQIKLPDFSSRTRKLVDVYSVSDDDNLVVSSGRQKIYKLQKEDGFVKGSEFNVSRNVLIHAGKGGCYLIDMDLDTMRMYPIGRVFNAIFETENTAFVAGFNGVNRLNLLTGELTAEAASKSRVEDLLLIEDELFIATRNNGVFIKKGDSIKVINESNGLPCNTIYCIASVNKNEIWLGTRKGVALLHRSDNSWRVSCLNRQDGLLANRVNSIDVSDSLVAVGTKKGLNLFTINELNKESELQLYMDSVLVGSLPAEPNRNSFQLISPNNSIEFFTSGICFQCGNNVTYKMLINGEENSNKTGHFSLSAMAPGSYTIQFLIFNNKEQYRELGQVYHLEILKPFWERYWFIAVCGFGLILIVLLIMRRVLKKRMERAKMISDINAYQQRALTLQMKPHFIFNSMNSIQNLILKEDKRGAHKYIANLARLMQRNLEHADVDLIALSDELEILQIYFDLEQRRLEKTIELKLEIELDVSIDSVGVPPFILQPLLENCIWHGLNDSSVEKPEISVRIKQIKNTLLIEVEDNGIGLDRAKRKKSFGTAKSSLILKLRLELLEKQYNFHSKYSVVDLSRHGRIGTLVQFNLPLQNANIE